MLSYVYILASTRKGTLYTGVTSDLVKLMSDHKLGTKGQLTKLYQAKLLVYYEVFEDILSAIEREKEIQECQRTEKIELIEQNNPWWHDLLPEIAGDGSTAA